MKHLLTPMLLCFALSVFGQNSTAQQKEMTFSNAEKFSDKSGILLQKEFIDLGNVGNLGKCKIQVAIFTDLISKNSVKAVRLEYYYPGDDNAKIALIDADEVDGALKSIKMLKESTFTTQPENYTEVYFTSRSGFCVGAFYANKKWTTFMEIKRGGYHSYVSIKEDDFTNLYALFQQAKAKL